jgi:plasmid maintenance system antidote protein VapI
MALRLGRLFGNSPEFWLNAQRAVDLWVASESVRDQLIELVYGVGMKLLQGG